MDANTDQQSIDEVWTLFQAADTDGNGVLSYDELHRILLAIGTPPEEVGVIWRACDTNGDGWVDFNEFFSWTFGETVVKQERMLGSVAVARRLYKRIRDQLGSRGVSAEALFQAADLDKNGQLGKGELVKMLMEFDPTLTDSVLEEAFSFVDDNGNGWIDVNEFTEVIHGKKQPWSMETQKVQVTCPYGSYPGSTVKITHAGSEYEVAVPAGVRPGEAFYADVQVAAQQPAAVTSQVEEVQVAVPYGYSAGHTLAIEHKGQTYNVTIPNGMSGGCVFNTQLQAPLVGANTAPVATPQDLQVTVPYGTYAGSTVTIQHAGQNYEVTVPAGYGPGQAFTTQVYVYAH